MSKLLARVTALVLPAKRGKAAPVRGRCGFGCGSNGVYNVSTTMPGGKPPCC